MVKKKVSKKESKNSIFKDKKILVIGVVVILFFVVFVYQGLKKDVLFSPDGWGAEIFGIEDEMMEDMADDMGEDSGFEDEMMEDMADDMWEEIDDTGGDTSDPGDQVAMAEDMARECTNHRDCRDLYPNEKEYCWSHTGICLECYDEAHCPDNEPICEIEGTPPLDITDSSCVACRNHGDCQDDTLANYDENKRICADLMEDGDKRCVECEEDNHCRDHPDNYDGNGNFYPTKLACAGWNPNPEGEGPKCVECESRGDCRAYGHGREYCYQDPSTVTEENPEGDPSTNICVECFEHSHCQMPEPACDLDSRSCTQCIRNEYETDVTGSYSGCGTTAGLSTSTINGQSGVTIRDDFCINSIYLAKYYCNSNGEVEYQRIRCDSCETVIRTDGYGMEMCDVCRNNPVV